MFPKKLTPLTGSTKSGCGKVTSPPGGAQELGANLPSGEHKGCPDHVPRPLDVSAPHAGGAGWGRGQPPRISPKPRAGLELPLQAPAGQHNLPCTRLASRHRPHSAAHGARARSRAAGRRRGHAAAGAAPRQSATQCHADCSVKVGEWGVGAGVGVGVIGTLAFSLAATSPSPSLTYPSECSRVQKVRVGGRGDRGGGRRVSRRRRGRAEARRRLNRRCPLQSVLRPALPLSQAVPCALPPRPPTGSSNDSPARGAGARGGAR